MVKYRNTKYYIKVASAVINFLSFTLIDSRFRIILDRRGNSNIIIGKTGAKKNGGLLQESNRVINFVMNLLEKKIHIRILLIK